MVTASFSSQRRRLAGEIRQQFVADAVQAMADIVPAVHESLRALMDEAAPSREMQARRDAWTFYQRNKDKWHEATARAWKEALVPPAVAPKDDSPDFGGLSLVGNDVVENKILASRLVLRVMDKVSSELDDLRLRIRYLEDSDDLDRQDILRPDVLVLILVEEWAASGMPAGSWPMVNDAVQTLLSERLKNAYRKGNQSLIDKGVMPTIDLKDRVKRAVPSSSAPKAFPSTRLASDMGDPHSGYPASGSGHGADPMHGSGYAPSGGGYPREPAASGGFGNSYRGESGAGAHEQGFATSDPQHGGFIPASGARPVSGMTHDETRMMTSTTPLARARSRAQGVLGQLKRMLVGRIGPEFEGTSYGPASPALAAALVPRGRGEGAAVAFGDSATVMEDYSPAGVAQVAGRLRQQTADLKNKAETKGEKATIEIVALMFQAILQEDRIPSAIRVWFARLQMPVLRVALAEPDFFGSANHPARQLIDRMGSCVMGFDASGIQGGPLEKEIKRIVQVIEQYPETGKRVYELVYAEFQKFLQKFLAGSGATQKVASVAQQVEQKETLTIQYTIEMRNMLKDIPVREEIRTFLFKVWAEVLAVAAVRKGPQHAETLELKRSSSDLVWAASAKPDRADRARVIQNLPKLLQRLRAGMTLLGMAPSQQDLHIKTVSDTLADAFLSKTDAIPAAQIEALAKRLANLEDFVSEDGMGDLPLDAESIELMLGIDPATIDVVANGGSKPSNAMLAWANELELGSWFTLDHNNRVVKVQFAWRSERKQLNLFASADGHSYLIQAGRLAAYLQAGLLLPQEEEALTVRATRDALAKLEANPERLLG
ncbi:MAG: DUF1631 domain-containing protein [Rhodoferax sp.]|nr:DUF1631 domain-containing protein [Rhodoferax sp.]MCB2029347.1 DUF1631 domain-containing protein [Rhodoferax sp.]